MGRYRDRKLNAVPGRQGRMHQRMVQRRLARTNLGVVSTTPGMRMMGMGPILAPIGLVTLLGFGVLGYALLTRPATPVQKVAKPVKPKRIPFWRKWRPFKKSKLPVTASAFPVVSAPVAVPVPVPVMNAPVATQYAAPAPLIHNRKVPITERAISKLTKRPVITNYRV